MLAPAKGRATQRLVAASTAPVVTFPPFLVPAFHRVLVRPRYLSATKAQPSKLGRTPISIPPGVELTIGDPHIIKKPTDWRPMIKRTVTVAGPLGKLDLDVPPFLILDHDAAAGRLSLSVEDAKVKQQREMWGTTWAYLHKYILGVSEGHTAVLRLVGIGYRASVEERPDKEEYPGQTFVCLKLGFSHPVEEGVPKGIAASTPQPTRILLEGINKVELMSFAAKIRKWRRPEPYKGKGVFVNNETIKLKQRKVR